MAPKLVDIQNFLMVRLQNAIADLGLDAALDFTYYATLSYTPSHFYDELSGIADGLLFSLLTFRNWRKL
jgi:hypothetical protein